MRHAVLLSPNPSGDAGGVERYTNMVGDILREDSWRVSLVGPTKQPGRWTFRFGGSPLIWSTSAGRAATALDPSPDLMIGNGFLGLGANGAKARIQIFHGTSIGETLAARRGLPRREFLRRMWAYWPVETLTSRAGTLVVVSESAGEETRRYYRHRPAAIIPGGVDERIFQPLSRSEARRRLGITDTRTLALFTGRIEYRKGGDLLSASCRRAGVELMVAGDRSVPGARHLGVLAPKELRLAYCAADCFLFPTRYEGCSLAILEAMMCETPVITTRVAWMGTFLRALPEYDSLCVEPTVESVATGLARFDGERARGLAAVARKWVLANNGRASFAARWRELIEQVTSAG